MPSSHRHANSAHGCSVCVAHPSSLQGRALFPSHVGKIVKCECATHKTKNLCLSTCFSFFVHVKCKLSFSRSYTMEDEGYVFAYTQTISRFFFSTWLMGFQPSTEKHLKMKFPVSRKNFHTLSSTFRPKVQPSPAISYVHKQLNNSSNPPTTEEKNEQLDGCRSDVTQQTCHLHTQERGCGIPRIFSHVLQFLFFFQLLLLLTNN